jgi:hypothetical protein
MIIVKPKGLDLFKDAIILSRISGVDISFRKQVKCTGCYPYIIKLYLLLYIIHRGEIVNHFKDKYTGWVPLPYCKLTKILALRGPEVKRLVIGPLKKLGIISIKAEKRYLNPKKANWRKWKKGRCYEYCLNPPYSLESGGQFVPLDMRYTLTDYQKRSIQELFAGKIFAHSELEKTLLANMERLRLDDDYKILFENNTFDTIGKQEYAKMLIRAINATEKTDVYEFPLPGWYFTRENSVNRLFTTITALPKKLRPYLRLEGLNLCEVDAHACHPFFLLLLYERTTPCEALVKERNAFYGLWEEDFYNAFIALAGGKWTRDELKDSFLSALNAPHRRYKSKNTDNEVAWGIYRAIKEHFPILYYQIWRLKHVKDRVLYPEVKEYRNGKPMLHTQISLWMQRIEAEVFVDGVARELTEKGVYCVTIHDGIACLKKDAEMVRECMVRHLRKRVRLEPRVKIK